MLRRLASHSGWLFAGALVALSSMASSLGGCATGAVSSDMPAPPASGGSGGAGGGTGGTGGSAGTGGTGLIAPMLEFTMPERLTLPRGNTAMLEVKAWPPGAYTVRFALLPGPGGTLPGDAALSATDVETNVDGRVTVTLTAPSAPTTFLVRASTEGGVPTTREVNVEKTGRADLRVERVYKGRPVTNWYATAVPSETGCPGPEEDSLTWTPGPSGKVVELLDLKADTKLAVIVRIEHFARGCATVPGVVEGVDNYVQVALSNVPIQLQESEVSISLDLAMFQPAFQTAAEPAIGAALSALSHGADDVSELLDRMQAEAGDDEGAFVTARASGGWDAAVRTALGGGAATALRDPLERWMRAGVANTSGGRFIGTLGAEGDDPMGALLTLDTFAGLPPESLGVSAENDATWYSSLAEDDVFFGSTLSLDPSLLVLGGAVAPARAEVDGAETIADALGTLLSCDAVANALVAHGATVDVSYPGCSMSCARTLCEDALATLVTELEERDEAEPSSLQISAATVATVGTEAELVGFEGTWVGSLVAEGESTPVGGTVLAPAP